MVGVENQVYEKDYCGKAPYSMNIYEGKRFPGAPCEISAKAELEQTGLLGDILIDEKAVYNDLPCTIPQCYYSDDMGARVCE